MKYTIKRTKEFRKNSKLMVKQGKDLEDLFTVVEILANGYELPEKYHDHGLIGNFKRYRECHIEPDWLLIYKITETSLILTLTNTGSHSQLFKK